MINIYNIDGSVLMQVPVTKEAKREEELSKSDYISLSFNAAVKVVLPVGAYIEYTYYIDDVRTVTRQFFCLSHTGQHNQAKCRGSTRLNFSTLK